MANTLLQYKNKVRRNLKDFCDVDLLGAAITSTTATTITVTDYTKYSQHDIIEIDNELLRVGATPVTTTVTVIRGYLGSTAATHLIGVIISINPRYFNIDIAQAINEALTQELWRTKTDDYSLAINSDVISTFESIESWTGGDIDTVYYKTGTRGRRITSTGSAVTSYLTVTKNLAGKANDKFKFWLFADDSSKITAFHIRFYTDDTNYFRYDFFNIADGFNFLEVERDDFTTTLTPNWAAITKIEFSLTCSSRAFVTIDSLILLYADIKYVYLLSTDVKKLLDVDISDSNYKILSPFNLFNLSKNYGGGSASAIQFNTGIVGSSKIVLRYATTFTSLSTDTSETDLPSEAEELPVYYACWKLSLPEETDRARYDRAPKELGAEANPVGASIRAGSYWKSLFEEKRGELGLNKLFAYRRRY